MIMISIMSVDYNSYYSNDNMLKTKQFGTISFPVVPKFHLSSEIE